MKSVQEKTTVRKRQLYILTLYFFHLSCHTSWSQPFMEHLKQEIYKEDLVSSFKQLTVKDKETGMVPDVLIDHNAV